jgi:hypothetical protein
MDALSLSGLEALSSCPEHCMPSGFGSGDTAAAGGMGAGNGCGQQRRNRYGGLSVLMLNGALGVQHASATISHLDQSAHPHLLAVLRSSRRAQRESLGDFGEKDRNR